ncbi:MAG: UDP-glucose/GDP-mannose dehydrogenase family protein [Chloroflexaceae bacterium]|nr:UDP-glucose/GDP-mannose dehydrogenase family protein [Chloroflexaceae bacterium]
MRVSIVGTGYVGLVTGACLAAKGHHVICVDVDQAKVALINRAQSPIYEPGLDELLRAHVGRSLFASTDLPAAVQETEITLVAVGTPFDGREIDLTYIRSAVRQIGEALRHKDDYHTVVIKSTVVPGTTDGVVLPLLEQTSGRRAGPDFGVGMNPEFLSEGEAVRDTLEPDRIILGGIDERSIEAQRRLFAVFGDVPMIPTNPRTAEMIKYASNGLQAALISFSNEIGNLCAALGDVDVVDVMRGVHLSRYLTTRLPDGTAFSAPITSFLFAGCGFGGSCFPKDVRALIAHGERAGAPMAMLNAVMQINDRQPLRLIELVRKHHPDLRDLPVAVLGLAFKPGTDDMRESPAIPVIESLLAQGAQVRAYDPQAAEPARQIFAGRPLAIVDSLEEALAGARVVVLVTRWDEFRRVPELIRGCDPAPLLVDGRRLIPRESVARYEGIGWSKR